MEVPKKFLCGGGVGWVGVASYPLLSQAPTHVEVELGCDKNQDSRQEAQMASN